MEQYPTDQTPFPPLSSLRHDADAKLPAAAFLRYESRADGWSAGRQAAFLAHLADHGVVEDAARCVGKHVSGGYALRREARGYAFNLGWEAALIIARRIVADNLMAAAIKGEQSRWVREGGVTTYIRQNTKLSLTLLDRVNPATALSEVLAVATRFDWFLQLVGDGVAAEKLWELFFEDALAHSEVEARARVRAALLLCDESAVFDDDGAHDDADGAGADTDDRRTEAQPIEYKSMQGPIPAHDSRGRRQALEYPAFLSSDLNQNHSGHAKYDGFASFSACRASQTACPTPLVTACHLRHFIVAVDSRPRFKHFPGRDRRHSMPHKSTRFAGPLLASIASLALVVPTTAIAQSRDRPAANKAKRESAVTLSPRRDQQRRDRRDGGPKPGPRDTGIKPPNGDRPTSP